MTFHRPPTKTTVRIANASIEVPVFQDQETTLEIAHHVTAQVQAIEKSYGRIDTQAFALRAAFDLAVELEQIRRNAEQESRDMIMALDELVTRLKDLVDNFGADPE